MDEFFDSQKDRVATPASDELASASEDSLRSGDLVADEETSLFRSSDEFELAPKVREDDQRRLINRSQSVALAKPVAPHSEDWPNIDKLF